jgi:ribonucleoside-triphosphate reductase
MKSVEQIDREIEKLKNKLEHVEGTKTEVYTRIVGYYRSVANWNKGKREEYNQRKLFATPVHMMKKGSKQPIFAEREYTEHPQSPTVSEETRGTGTVEGQNIARYSYFFRQTCPNCPPVRDYLEGLEIKGKQFDVDTSEGMEKATEHQVLTAPTVIFFDGEGKEMFRAHNVDTMNEVFNPIKIEA